MDGMAGDFGQIFSLENRIDNRYRLPARYSDNSDGADAAGGSERTYCLFLVNGCVCHAANIGKIRWILPILPVNGRRAAVVLPP